MEALIKELNLILSESEIRQQEPMNRHTTFQVGGPAELFLLPEPKKLGQVMTILHRYTVPVTVMGNGSNLLVGDGGIDGVVLAFGKNTESICCEGNVITAGAGAMLSKTAASALKNGLAGMEFASGIPGSIGGAMVMNAGAYGGEIKDITLWVEVLTPEGEVKCLSASEMDFGYRHSCIEAKGYLIVRAAFALKRDDEDAIKMRMDELREKRLSKQPLQYPSAGSTFKRPEGHFAGKLIMDAGLAGCQIGGAQVSQKHCGFIINRGGATAEDIRRLITHVQDTVEEKFQVRLETEVKMLGKF